MSETGHNSGDARLRSIVDRIVRLTEERKALAGDIKEVFSEGKSAGYDQKALRATVKCELEDDVKRLERERVETERDLMLAAIGPLGAAAVRR